MKLVLFSGNHSRHVFINSEIARHFDETLCIMMGRENLLPEPPDGISNHDKDLFVRHFANRKVVEDEIYGNISHHQITDQHHTIFVQPQELNTEKMADMIAEFDADISFIFGVDLILDPVLSKLPENKINLHLGLSPWYKGAATLFWPFYFLQPQFAGVTFHQITPRPDAGEIIHQSVPKLNAGDTIHDVGARCVIQAREDIRFLFKHWDKHRKFNGHIQKTTGRVWRSADFHPTHLRVIYDLYDDKIVDAYLSGELDQRLPKIVSCLSD